MLTTALWSRPADVTLDILQVRERCSYTAGRQEPGKLYLGLCALCTSPHIFTTCKPELFFQRNLQQEKHS